MSNENIDFYLKDIRLSLRAKGLLGLMEALPEQNGYYLSYLMALCNDKQEAVKNALCELEMFGYVTTKKVLKTNPTKKSKFDHFVEIK